MKKINPKKLLPAPVAKNQASFSQKFLVPASRVTVNDSAKVKDTVSTPQQKDLKEQSLSLKRKFISLTKLFGIKTNLERKKNKQKRVELENERRQKREEEKETGKTTFKFGANLPKLALPRVGFLDTIKRFLLYGLLGFAIDKIIPVIPSLLKFASKLQPAFEFFKTVASGIVGGVVGFIDSSYKAYNFVKRKIDEIIGPDKTNEFDQFTKNLNTVLNGALLAAGLAAIASKKRGPLGKSGLDKGRVGLALGAAGAAGLYASRYTFRTAKDTAPIFTSRLSNMLLRGSMGLPAAKELPTKELLKNPAFALQYTPQKASYTSARDKAIAESIVDGATDETTQSLRRAGVGVLDDAPQRNTAKNLLRLMGFGNTVGPNEPYGRLKRGINVEKIFETYDQPSLPGMGRRSKKKLSTDASESRPRTKAEADAEFFKSLEKDPTLRAGAEQQFAVDVKKQKDADLDRSLKNILDLSDEEFNRRIKDARGPEASRQLEFDLGTPKTPAGRRKNLLARLLGGPGEQELLDAISKDPTPSRTPSKLRKPPTTPFKFLRGALSRNIFKGLLGPLIGGVLDFLLSVLFGDPLGVAAAGAIGATIGTAIGSGIGSLPPFIALGGPFIGGIIGGIGGDLFGRFLYENFINRKQTDERLKKLAEFINQDKKPAPAKALLPKEDEKKYFGVNPVITSRFGEMRGNRPHLGTDIAVPTGTPLVPVTDAIIVDYGDLSRSDAKRGEPGGWGNFIVYRDINGYYHLYAHLNSIVKKSGSVKRGEKIATVGNTGRSTDPHLHWELGTMWTGNTMEGKMDPLNRYSVMAPFAVKGGKQKANLAPPNRNVASGLNDLPDDQQVEIALLPIVEQVETMSQSPSGGGGVIVLNSNAPSRFAPALIG